MKKYKQSMRTLPVLPLNPLWIVSHSATHVFIVPSWPITPGWQWGWKHHLTAHIMVHTSSSTNPAIQLISAFPLQFKQSTAGWRTSSTPPPRADEEMHNIYTYQRRTCCRAQARASVHKRGSDCHCGVKVQMTKIQTGTWASMFARDTQLSVKSVQPHGECRGNWLKIVAVLHLYLLF